MNQNQKLIELCDVSVSFDDQKVLDALSLSIRDGEFVTLLGPSGCGKTTTLRIIAGFIQPDEGDVYFGSERINGVPPHKRQVNTIFQRYALFPHYNVFDNVAYGLRVKNVPKDEIKERVHEMLRLVNLEGLEHRKISKLSGGQQQRVAVARAVINRPKVLLLDEPLAALDLKLRKDMQRELKNIQKQLGITFIFVTHDQEEALSMSDTVDFIGESNILDGIMPSDYKATFAGHTFDCLDAGFAPGEAVDVVIRPEDVDIVAPEKAMLTGTVTSVTFLGVHYEIIVDIRGFKWMIQTTDYCGEGETVGLYIEPDAIHIMKKSEYSGKYGDYSTFSDEMEEINQIPEDAEDD